MAIRPGGLFLHGNHAAPSILRADAVRMCENFKSVLSGNGHEGHAGSIRHPHCQCSGRRNGNDNRRSNGC